MSGIDPVLVQSMTVIGLVCEKRLENRLCEVLIVTSSDLKVKKGSRFSSSLSQSLGVLEKLVCCHREDVMKYMQWLSWSIFYSGRNCCHICLLFFHKCISELDWDE